MARLISSRKTTISLGVIALLAGLAVLPRDVLAQKNAAAKTPERRKAEALVGQGLRLSDGSAKEEALYLEAYKIDPSYAKPLFNLGLVYTDRKQYELAITYFEKYVLFHPGSFEGLYQLGASNDNRGHDKEAIRYYMAYLKALARSNARPEERKYKDAAVTALKRLSPKPKGPKETKVASRGEEMRNIVRKMDEASVNDIVKILTRPRTRGIFRFDGPVYATSRINFAKDSTEFLPGAAEQLDRIAAAIQSPELAKIKIRVGGYCSTEGTKEHNLELSKRRAGAVREYLSKKYGIAPERVECEGYGAENPLVPEEKDESARQTNRRVEFENMGLASKPTVESAGDDMPQ